MRKLITFLLILGMCTIANAAKHPAIKAGGETNNVNIDGNGDIQFSGSSGLAYGGIYVEGVDVGISLAAQDTYSQVTAWSNGGAGASCASNQTTPDASNDHITVSNTGTYYVSFHVSAYSSQKNVYEFECFKNNGATGFDCTESYRTTATASAIGAVSGGGLISLTAGDTLELWVERKDGGGTSKTITVRAATMSVVQVGG